MDKYLVVVLVLIFCIALIAYTQKDAPSKKPLKQQLQDAFPRFKVIEKNQAFYICKMNVAQFDEELVLIRIDPNQANHKRMSGQLLILTYHKQPSLRTIKTDIGQHLYEN